MKCGVGEDFETGGRCFVLVSRFLEYLLLVGTYGLDPNVS
jgi:hypothetical protein